MNNTQQSLSGKLKLREVGYDDIILLNHNVISFNKEEVFTVTKDLIKEIQNGLKVYSIDFKPVKGLKLPVHITPNNFKHLLQEIEAKKEMNGRINIHKDSTMYYTKDGIFFDDVETAYVRIVLIELKKV